jgi:DNA polymerase-3 subunit epsilon
MIFTRPIVFCDIESTGTDIQKDRIIELGVAIYGGPGEPKVVSKRFNPGMPIPAAATEIHHITDADVAGCPPFSEFAPKLHKALQGKDLGGFNLLRYDLPLLDEEMRRCGLKIDLTGVLVVDAYGIFANKEPRNLEAAVQRYCHRPHEGAHGAGVDARASLDVFAAQLIEYPDLDSADAVALASRIGDRQPVDIAGKFYRDPHGDLRFNFGKNRDQKVADQIDYCYWMLNSKPGFPGSTVETLNIELDRIEGVKK